MSEGLETLTKLEYLTAWRTWRVWMSQDVPSLYSVSSPEAWTPCEAMQARCGYLEMNPPACACDSCPGDDTHCGIHAYNQQGFRSNLVGGTRPRLVQQHLTDIIGRVALWGTVIEHEEGFRGQYAYPLSLSNGHCAMCRTGLRSLNEMWALIYESGEGWVIWLCEDHAKDGLDRATVMGPPRDFWGQHPDSVQNVINVMDKRGPGWVLKPGLEVANVIAELYQLAIET